MCKRMFIAALAGLFVFGSLAGCAGSYSPRKEGVCNPGRVWVPPQKNDKGEWKAGYCIWADQAPASE